MVSRCKGSGDRGVKGGGGYRAVVTLTTPMARRMLRGRWAHGDHGGDGECKLNMSVVVFQELKSVQTPTHVSHVASWLITTYSTIIDHIASDMTDLPELSGWDVSSSAGCAMTMTIMKRPR